MAGGIEVTWDGNALFAMLRGPSGAVAQDIRRRGNRVLAAARRNAPVDTGSLRGSLNLRMTTEDGSPAAVIGTNIRHAMWVHEGTGIYGPRGTMIRPTHARFLAWRSRSTGQWIFARQVRGMRGRPFLADAINAAL
jgi:phage gpG-like protein